MNSINSRAYGTSPSRRVAFLGLGVMGFPMAGHLARAGHQVCVFNRTAEKALRWSEEFGGSTAPSVREAVAGADLVMSCVGNDDDLRSVTLGDQGAFAAMKPGAVFVDHTTASAEVARELSKQAVAAGLHFLDAPVSGGQMGARNGMLTVMCGGDSQVFDQVQAVLGSYARAVTLMGPSGAGQLAKMVNQVCLAGLVQALSEGIAFGQKAGLDMVQVLDAIGKGAAQSWQMDNRGKAMIADDLDSGFAIDLLRKDLGLALGEARRNGAQLPVTALVDQFYADLQRQGAGKRDSANLINRLR